MGQSKTNEGLVVAVGPGARTDAGETVPMSVTVGDKVLLPEFGGSKIEVDGEEFHMFRETDLVARLNKKQSMSSISWILLHPSTSTLLIIMLSLIINIISVILLCCFHPSQLKFLIV